MLVVPGRHEPFDRRLLSREFRYRRLPQFRGLQGLPVREQLPPYQRKIFTDYAVFALVARVFSKCLLFVRAIGGENRFNVGGLLGH